jgi:hypothetical protein
MDSNQTSTTRTVAPDFLDLCPWCEADVDPHYADGEHWAECTSCSARGPVEHNMADMYQSWNDLVAKVLAFERMREVVENASRVPA